MPTTTGTRDGSIRQWVALIAALLIGGACMDTSDVKNFNSESADALIQTPTPSSIATSVQGLMVNARASIVGEPTGYLHSLSQKGRETYTMDAATPGLIPLDFVGPLGPESDNFWSGGYRGIKLGQVIIKALETVTGMSDPQKEGVRGFTKTMQAYEFWKIIANHDQSGAVTDVDATFATEAKPIVGRDGVYAFISQLLDDGKASLTAAGTTPFMFKLSPGFAGFDTPANFLKVNRALKARIEVYRGSFAGMPAGAPNYNAALTALTESFISTAAGASLALGAHHTYTTNSGDASNTMFDPTGRVFHAHPSFETDAQLRADLTRDLRYVNKTFKKAPRTQSGVTSDLGVRVYGSNTASLPIIKNEELILLRAEANLALGNRGLALADINYTRVNAGGLPTIIADPGDPGLMDQLVYERRYSLFFEGHRWYDMRRWGRLAQLPKDRPDGRIFSRIPLPLSECNGRSPAPTGCQPDPGI